MTIDVEPPQSVVYVKIGGKLFQNFQVSQHNATTKSVRFDWSTKDVDVTLPHYRVVYPCVVKFKNFDEVYTRLFKTFPPLERKKGKSCGQNVTYQYLVALLYCFLSPCQTGEIERNKRLKISLSSIWRFVKLKKLVTGRSFLGFSLGIFKIVEAGLDVHFSTHKFLRFCPFLDQKVT